MQKMNKIIRLGSWSNSSANGGVYSIDGISPTLCVGCHSGVEPKILIVKDDKI